MKPFPLFRQFLLIALFVFAVIGHCSAQYYKNVLQKLASKIFDGRGYVDEGDRKAASYIATEFKKAGLFQVNGTYLHPFEFPVNTFPGAIELIIDDSQLVPGKDFIVSPSCPGIKGEFKILKANAPIQDLSGYNLSDIFLLFDKSGLDSTRASLMDSLIKNPPPVRGLLIVEPQKLTWSVSTRVNEIAVIRILKSALPKALNTIKVNIENAFIPDHQAYNVAGYLPGTANPDSFIVFTAHYDHLGRMGKKTMFAGANDNASGTSMIIDLARFYTRPENRIGKSILFIAFAGEEAGLLGSKYYTDHPLFRMDRIKFLLNLDLMGNGDEGLMVVNGSVFQNEFAILDSINNQTKGIKTIGKRGTAKNSDHYWFSERGVPAFFFYTNGGSKAYHDIYDTPQQLPLTEFDDIKKLIVAFIGILGH